MAVSDDRVRGLAEGADDYLRQAGSLPGAAAHASPRSCAGASRGRRGRGGWASEVDVARREGRGRRQPVRLADKEFELLRALAADPTRVFTKLELLADVWGFRTREQTRTLDSHASRLRRKLDPEGGRYVDNCWGVGYRLLDGREDGTRRPAHRGP